MTDPLLRKQEGAFLLEEDEVWFDMVLLWEKKVFAD